MYDSILVPLDGSSQAEWALPTAIRLAQATGASLNLITVDVPVPVLAIGLATTFRRDTEVAPAASVYLQQMTARIARTSGIVVTPSLIEPNATWFPSIGHQIASHADQTDAGVIVMTTHARPVVPRMFLGSVAHAVVRRSGTPVLLIKPPAARTPELSNGVAFRRVLIALDGSASGEEVLRHAVELGRLDGAEYTLFRAVEPQRIAGTPVVPVLLPIDAVAVQDAEAAARLYLDRIADRLRKRELRVVTRVALAPNAADAIVQCAENESVDVIAMTTHARGVVAGALLGSVANRVIRRATVPILLYRPQGE